MEGTYIIVFVTPISIYHTTFDSRVKTNRLFQDFSIYVDVGGCTTLETELGLWIDATSMRQNITI